MILSIIPSCKGGVVAQSVNGVVFKAPPLAPPWRLPRHAVPGGEVSNEIIIPSCKGGVVAQSANGVVFKAPPLALPWRLPRHAVPGGEVSNDIIVPSCQGGVVAQSANGVAAKTKRVMKILIFMTLIIKLFGCD